MIKLKKPKDVSRLRAVVEDKPASIKAPIYSVRTGKANPFGFMHQVYDLSLEVFNRHSTPLEISCALREDIQLLVEDGKHTQLAVDIIEASKNKDFKQWLKSRLAKETPISII